MKVTLLAVNAKYVHSSLAVWSLMAGIRSFSRYPHDVTVVEANINQQINEIAGRIAASEPEVVGVSTYIWNAGMLPGLFKLVRDYLPEALIVLGGPEASHNAVEWLCHADYILYGEGERSFPAFLDMLCENAPLETVPGLCWKQDGEARMNPEAAPLTELIDPYGDGYLTALDGRIAYLETSRGCPFRCAFCLSGREDGVRYLGLDEAKGALRRLSRSGALIVKLVDRTFNCNPKRAYKLFEYVISLDTDCTFHFEAAADLFDDDTVSLLATAPPGRIQLEAGLQSFHAPALKAVSRQTDLDKAQRNLHSLRQAGNIHIHVDLIAGLPYEDLTGFQNSFGRAYALRAHNLQLGFLKLLHGSALRERAQSYGIEYSHSPPYEITGSPWLSGEDLLVLKKTESALRHTYNKGRFLSALEYTLSASGIRPFALYQMLGEAVPAHGVSLGDYAEALYSCLIRQAGIDADELRRRMILDWMGMQRGVNMPPFLKVEDGRLKRAKAIAENRLRRKIRRYEAAMLPGGKSLVFVDGERRDRVTGLYEIFVEELD